MQELIETYEKYITHLEEIAMCNKEYNEKSNIEFRNKITDKINELKEKHEKKNLYAILKDVRFSERTRRQLTILINSINNSLHKMETKELSKKELWLYRQFIFSFIQEVCEIIIYGKNKIRELQNDGKHKQ